MIDQKKEIISSDDNLLRRVLFMNPSFIKPDGTISSACFKLKKNEVGLSVDIERLTDYAVSIQDRRKFRLYSINAGFAQSLSLETTHNPLPDNTAHALINGKITKSVSRKLAVSAIRIAYPD